MEDFGLTLTFEDPAEASAFAAAIEHADFSFNGLRIATFEEKQNLDSETLTAVMKIAGALAPAVLTFLKWVRDQIKKPAKPTVSLRHNDRVIEVHGDVTDEELQKLADVLIRSK